MKKAPIAFKTFSVLLIAAAIVTFNSCSNSKGKTIPPTNKKFKFSMATTGHWKDGKMFEEFLFWDNQSFIKQIGL